MSDVDTTALRRLADAVEASPSYLQNAWWQQWGELGPGPDTPREVNLRCGAPGCLAGHALALRPELRTEYDWPQLLADYARLPYKLAELLCEGSWGEIWAACLADCLDDVAESDLPACDPDPTAEHAAALLRFVADHYDAQQGVES